jgi:hypothetical protein
MRSRTELIEVHVLELAVIVFSCLFILLFNDA